MSDNLTQTAGIFHEPDDYDSEWVLSSLEQTMRDPSTVPVTDSDVRVWVNSQMNSGRWASADDFGDGFFLLPREFWDAADDELKKWKENH